MICRLEFVLLNYEQAWSGTTTILEIFAPFLLWFFHERKGVFLCVWKISAMNFCIMLLFDTGMRCNEMILMEPEDIKPDYILVKQWCKKLFCLSYMIDKMSSGRNYYKQRSAEENCCNRDWTAPPYHRDLRGRFWHWGRRCCNLGRSSGWFFTDNVRFLRPQPYEPHDSWSKNPVVRITSIRGVVKNLVRDTDPVEWDRCSISPDRIRI